MSSRLARVSRTAALLAAAAALLSGCSTDAQGTVKSDTKAAVSALVAPPPDLDQAVLKASIECLSRHGFNVPYSPAFSSTAATSVTGVAGLPPSAESARAHGYTTTQQDGEAVNAVGGFREALSPAEQARFDTVYTGSASAARVSVTLADGSKAEQSSEGCFAEANVRVYGSIKTDLELSQFPNEMYSLVDTRKVAKAVRDALPAYEKCMKDHGYAVTGLNADKVAAQRFGKYRQPGDPPSRDESAMASRDAQCQAQSGMVENSEDVFYAGAAKWITNNESSILAHRAAINTAVANAKRVLGG